MIKYVVQYKLNKEFRIAFRITCLSEERKYLKEKYNFYASIYDVGKFLVINEEIGYHFVTPEQGFNEWYSIVTRIPIYPWIPFKSTDNRPKLSAFSSGSVYDWLRKELGSIACIDTDTIHHLDIREMKKEKDTMITKSKTINFCVKKVIFNGPATIVIWGDGTKTVVKCADGDSYSKWAGFAMCIAKRLYGDDFHHQFRNFCGVEDDIPKKNTTGDGASISETFKELGKSACGCAENLSKALEGYSKVPDYRDVVFKDTFETGLVLKNMRNIIDTLGFVSVADCCHLVGAMIHVGDHDIGWTDISKAMIVRVKNGFLIKYPEPAARDRFNRVEKEPDFLLRKVYYGSHTEARKARETLQGVIRANGYATVADYYYISNVDVGPEELKNARKYGWRDIGVANVGLCGLDKFKLDIPEPKRLNMNWPKEAKGID